MIPQSSFLINPEKLKTKKKKKKIKYYKTITKQRRPQKKKKNQLFDWSNMYISQNKFNVKKHWIALQQYLTAFNRFKSPRYASVSVK